MRGLRPIPLRLLAEDAVVRVLDGEGGYAEGVAVSQCGSRGRNRSWTMGTVRLMLVPGRSTSTR